MLCSRHRAPAHERMKLDEATEKCSVLQTQLEESHRRSTADNSEPGDAHSTYSLSGISMHASADAAAQRPWHRADEPPLHIVAPPIRGHSSSRSPRVGTSVAGACCVYSRNSEHTESSVSNLPGQHPTRRTTAYECSMTRMYSHRLISSHLCALCNEHV